MSNEQRIKELINNLKAREAPGYDDPRDAMMNVGKFHQSALDELKSIGVSAVPFLIEESKDPKIRDLIRNIGEGTIDPLLSHLQENPDSPYSEYVIGTLGLLKAEAASGLILNYLQTSDNLDIRVKAAMALGMIHREKAKIDTAPMYELLDTLLKDAKTDSNGRYEFSTYSDGTRCEEVVGGIGSAGDKRATDGLIGLLGKTKGLLKVRVAQALGAIGDEKAVSPLIESIDSQEEFSDLMTKELVKFKDPRGREFAEKFVQENPKLQYTNLIKDELAKMPASAASPNKPVTPEPQKSTSQAANPKTSEPKEPELQPAEQKAPESNKRSKILVAVGIGAAVLCLCCVVASLAISFWGN